jgi:clan AA aspartic protease
MTRGHVTYNLEAEVTIHVLVPTGNLLDLVAIVDTGFTDHLIIPSDAIELLGLGPRGTMEAVMADGTVTQMQVYRCMVKWQGSLKQIPVAAADGGPLIGMSLLHGCQLTMDIVDGGAVTIAPLPQSV